MFLPIRIKQPTIKRDVIMNSIKYITVIAVLFTFAFSSTAQEKPEGSEKEGKITPILWEDGVENAYPRWSNDGTKILYQSNRTGRWQIYIMDIDGSNKRRVTIDKYNNNFPAWSPDNKQIAFVSDRKGNEDVYVMNIDGSGLKNLSNNPARDIHPYWSPDGEKILFNSSRDDEESFEVYQVNVDRTGLKRLTDTKEVETCARFSPNGKKIVYLKGTPGRNDEVCVMNSDGTGQKYLTKSDSNEGWPVWAPGGKQIIYSSTWDGQFCLFSMNADGSDMKRISIPEAPYYDARASVSPDGKEIVFNRQAEGTTGIYILELD